MAFGDFITIKVELFIFPLQYQSKFILNFFLFILMSFVFRCRDQELIWDACMYRKLGMEKPPFGYFSQVRVHDPERPKPAKWVADFPEPSGIVPPELPEHKKGFSGAWTAVDWFNFGPRKH